MLNDKFSCQWNFKCFRNFNTVLCCIDSIDKRSPISRVFQSLISPTALNDPRTMPKMLLPPPALVLTRRHDPTRPHRHLPISATALWSVRQTGRRRRAQEKRQLKPPPSILLKWRLTRVWGRRRRSRKKWRRRSSRSRKRKKRRSLCRWFADQSGQPSRAIDHLPVRIDGIPAKVRIVFNRKRIMTLLLHRCIIALQLHFVGIGQRANVVYHLRKISVVLIVVFLTSLLPHCMFCKFQLFVFLSCCVCFAICSPCLSSLLMIGRLNWIRFFVWFCYHRIIKSVCCKNIFMR